jgi:hypothetical protein
MEREVLSVIYLSFENSRNFAQSLPADIRVSKTLVTRYYISVAIHTD